ncbi:hypothetical protein [Actinoplanes sp. ATCC 53533]|uniref:hypothetical protein n=1 Tax=Actinoplanes sp. ATCC 53533 TaxID=1288362 RepID=UPI000F79B8B2|nr:hypothetical protein [Actinoplanes sp. ATCC 53533]
MRRSVVAGGGALFCGCSVVLVDAAGVAAGFVVGVYVRAAVTAVQGDAMPMVVARAAARPADSCRSGLQ